jgi:hypothetical protein
MLLKFINSNRISINIVILVLVAAYWVLSLFTFKSAEIPAHTGAPPGSLIISLNGYLGILATILTLSFIVFNGYLLVQLNTINIFIPARTQLPALFYFILVIFSHRIHQFTPALLSSALLIFILFRVFNTYKTEGLSYNFLDAGILVSLAGIVYFPAFFFFPVLLISLKILKPFNWREWAYVLIGFAIPFIFFFSICFLADIPVVNYFNELAETFTPGNFHFSVGDIITWSYLFLLIIISSYFMMGFIGNMKIHARKLFIILFWIFIFSILIYLIVPGAGIEMVYFLAIPVAYLLSYYFIRCRRNWLNDILFALFLLMLLVQTIK